MRNTNEASLWAVYQVAANGKQDAAKAMCDQREWAFVESQGQGRCTLIRANITSEAEAERLARGTSGDPVIRQPRNYSPTVAQV
jgi:hypothetical protein